MCSFRRFLCYNCIISFKKRSICTTRKHYEKMAWSKLFGRIMAENTFMLISERRSEKLHFVDAKGILTGSGGYLGMNIYRG